MKKILLTLILFVIAKDIELRAQCQSTLVRQSVQCRQTNQSIFYNSYNTLATQTTRDSSGITITKLFLYENNQWLNLPQITSSNLRHQVIRLNNKILCCNKVILDNKSVQLNNYSMPTGYYYSVFELKNGAWDTLQGSLITTKSSFVNFVATDYNLYYCYVTGLPVSTCYKYDTTAKQFKKIMSSDKSFCELLPCKKRVYFTSVNSVNGKPTNGFAYYENDSLFTITDTFYKVSNFGFSYVVDYENNYLVGINYKDPNNTKLQYFSRNTYYTRANTSYTMPSNVSGYSFSGNANKKSLSFIVTDNANNYKYHMTLCDSSSNWTFTGVSGYDWSNLSAYKDTFYLLNYKDKRTYRFGEGFKVQGKVYIDKNQDCNYNGNDYKLRKDIIEFKSINSPMRIISSTDTGANYSINLSNDSFVAIAQGNLTACSLDTVYVKSNATVSDISIIDPQGIYFESGYNNNKFIRWNLPSNLFFKFKNRGEPIDSVHYKLSFGNGIKVQTRDSNQTAINDSTLSMRIYSINYFEKRYLNMGILVDTGLYHSGDTFWGRFTVDAFKNGNKTTKKDSCKFKVVYSYDPNQITVNRNLIQPLLDTRLDYFIEFQNEGNDDAWDVVIIDTLPWILNPETFAVSDASHPFQLELNHQVLKITFRDIYLKPKSVNEPKSKGFFSFKIDTRYGIKNGDSIRNRAHIYFDLNAPVITNYAVTKASDKIVSIANILKSIETIYIYPNPSGELVSIKGKGPISIYSSEGQLIHSNDESECLINTSQWSSGIYIISDGTTFGKLIKL